jgi:hypothetical protein
MLVHGGEPPHIEDPEPRLGGVLAKLNEIAFFVQEQTQNYNEGTKGKLLEFTNALAQFNTEVVVPISAHLSATGAQHGETAKTVGLDKKDNYRTATLAEQTAMADVDAFVTPQGAKAAIQANNDSFDATLYQKNDVLQMASYFFPDDYPRMVPTRPEPIRYLGVDGQVGRVPMLFNGDRMVFSVRQDTAKYQGQSLFVSGPTKVARKTQLEEITNVKNYYTGLGWNNIAGQSSAGSIGFFHPIADKNIHEFKSSLTLPATESRAFLLYRGYGSATYKGMGVAVTNAGNVITLHHRFFKVNLLETDPTMINVVDGTYPATFNTLAGASSGVAQGSHSFNVTDFLTLPAGSSIQFGGDSQGISVSLFWNAQDYEAHAFIAVSLGITGPTGTFNYVTLRFRVSIIPGTLAAGGSATFSVVGSRVKDVLPANLVPASNAEWCEQGSRWNMNSPVHLPGCILNNGEIVKSRAGKYVLRVKRHYNGFAGLKEWIVGPRPVVNIKYATTEIMVPGRHGCFTQMPERIIPISHSDAAATYLVYGVDVSTGRYRWQEVTWSTNSMMSVDSGNKFGIRLPDVVFKRDELSQLPTALSCYTSSTGNGAVVSALAFTNNNGFEGHTSFQYTNGVLTLGAAIDLSPLSLLSLQASMTKVLERAKAFNPGVTDGLRKAQIQVFALTATKAIYILTDGLCYAEAGVAPYSIASGTFVLDFAATGGIKLTRVTTAVASLPGTYRESYSGDGPQMQFNDLMAVQLGTNRFDVVATRAFGEVYGDLSISVSNLDLAIPTVEPIRQNNARLYTSNITIDAVDELYPAFLIPKKGLYQYDPASDTSFSTIMQNVSNTAQKVDPFDINEAGWVRVPAGAKVLINGRAYVLDQDYAVKVNPTGTTYCYLVRAGNVLSAIGSSIIRESANTEVQFGVAVNGVLQINHSYLVMAHHVVSPTRRGSAIPTFEDNGANGVNQFFTQRDRI